MKTKTFYYICIFVLISISVSASLEISPSEANSDVIVNTPHQASITITNNHNFPIFNITPSSIEYFNFPIIEQLAPHVSTEYNFTIHTDTSFERAPFTSIVSYRYYIEIPQEPITHNISINDDHYNPNTLELYTGDTINFINNGTISHSITSNKWDYTLPVSSEQPILFTEVGEISFYDKYIFFTGNLNIKNRTNQELAHNPQQDKQLKINLESRYSTTELELEITKTNYSIKWNSVDEGLLSITNKGTETAHNLNLEDNSDEFNFDFDENDFNLEPDQTNYITFQITPNINQTIKTNRTYNVTILLDSENAGNTGKILSIYIPYHEYNQNESIADWWEEMKEFCIEYPTSPHCISEPIIQYINITNSTQEAVLTINMTEAQWKNLLIDIRKGTDTSERIENQWKQDVGTIMTGMADIKNTSETTKQTVDLNKKKQKQNAWIIGLTIFTFISIICIISIAGALYISKKKKMADIISGIGESN